MSQSCFSTMIKEILPGAELMSGLLKGLGFSDTFPPFPQGQRFLI